MIKLREMSYHALHERYMALRSKEREVSLTPAEKQELESVDKETRGRDAELRQSGLTYLSESDMVRYGIDYSDCGVAL